MAGRELYRGQVHVDYGQAYVLTSGPWRTELDACFSGQANGLCGAAQPHGLWLTFGLNVGPVPFCAERHDDPPGADDSWEEIVEAPFVVPEGSSPGLLEWGAARQHPLDISAGSYRVRYCASGMDAAQRAGVRVDQDPPLDRYLLQFWPSPWQPDAVVKATSAVAARRHDWVRGLR